MEEKKNVEKNTRPEIQGLVTYRLTNKANDFCN